MFKGISAPVKVDMGVTHSFKHAVISINVNVDSRKMYDIVTLAHFLTF